MMTRPFFIDHRPKEIMQNEGHQNQPFNFDCDEDNSDQNGDQYYLD